MKTIFRNCYLAIILSSLLLVLIISLIGCTSTEVGTDSPITTGFENHYIPLAALYQTAMDPAGGIGQAGMLPPVPEELLQDMFQSFSVKQWIAKDTYFLMKTEIDIDVESTPELMEYLGEEVDVSVDITINFLAYNYNQPVNIEVPQEALEAIEAPME